MTDARAMYGDLADFRNVKSRKVIQLIVEIPIERGAEMTRMFGWPNPASTVPVAIARLNEGGAKTEQQNGLDPAQPALAPPGRAPNKHWHELSPAQQAGILCSDPSFRQFLAQPYPDFQMLDVDMAADEVRARCKVRSRSELETNDTARSAWRKIVADYRAWQREPEVVG